MAARSALKNFLQKLRKISVFSSDNEGTEKRHSEIQLDADFTMDDDEWIQVTDENFFENFTVLSWRRENNRLQIARQEEGERDKPPPPESDFPLKKYIISKKQWEELYVEVLYTIKHKLGANSSNYAAYTDDMYEYARETFRMSGNDHAKFMAVAQEEKPPIPVLNVIVVEAQGLEAKDPNGFSDPYCMLGIQPDPDAESRRRSEGDEESGSRRSLKRFGASFKKRDRRDRNFSDVLPAKFIRTTSVKTATLNPKWREKFRLDIDDARSDRLHLDIWDHDDETSVFDAARKLNEVSNLKGLGRYFKEVAQSARTSIGDNVDDFLGCVNVPLEEVSAAGVDRWFTLQGRTHRSSVQGQIHLKLQLGTREDRGMATGEDNWREVVEHQQLIWIFVDHELRMFQGPSYEWAGDLPQQALTILHQHAIQGDITELQQSVCQWTAYYRKHSEVTLDYALIFQQLDELSTNWDKNEEALSMEEEADMAETFNEFADHCIELLRHHRKLFPPHNSHAWHKLKFILKCLSFLYSMNAFRTCFPFRNELHVEVTNTLKRGTLEWMMVVQEKFQHDPDEGDSIPNLIKFIDALNIDLQKATSHYCYLFQSIVRVNYAALVYKQMEKQLCEEIAKRIGTKALQEINNSPILVTAQNRDYINKFLSRMSETDVFELFLVLQEFCRFKDCLPKDEQSSLIIVNCHVWFADAVNQWFSVAKSKVRRRIYYALEHDKALMESKTPVKELKPANKGQQSQLSPLSIKYSVSAIDTVLSFIQLKEFWHQLAWPDKFSSYPYVLAIVQAIASGVVLYCNLIWKRLRDDSSCFSDRGRIELSNKVLLYVNNMEYVLDGLKNLGDDLETEAIFQALEKQEGQKVSENCRAEIETLIFDAQDHVHQKIESVVNNIADQMRPAIQKLMFHLAWAPEKLEPEKCVTPLMEYLEKSFKEMNSNFLKPTFQRLMQAIWGQVLSEISIMTRSNIGKERPPFFHRLFTSLHMLAEFFHRDESMLHISRVQNSSYQELEKELRLQKADTTQLIDLYYLQRMEDQSKLHHAPFGSLTVNAYYDEMKQAVCVEVISAKDLIPCDPNGLSDPFVILQLIPKHLFPNSSTYKTKTHMRTLHPLFQEYFEWPVKWEVCGVSAAAVNFVVMDYDYMRKNDFEGEAYLALHTLAGATEERTTEPTELVLMSPSDKSDILTTLAVRTWDKQAMEVLRQEKRKHS